MPIGMPQKSLITVQRRELPADFMMPQMEMASTHYSIGYLISGDRRMITPYQQIDLHDGDFSVMPPMLYHRTFSLSDRPYINYLIKISEELASDFQKDIDPKIWRAVFDQRCISFDEENTAKAQALLADMLEVYEQDAEYSPELLRGMLYRLIVLMWEKNRHTDDLQFKDKLSAEIMETMYFIERSYSEDIKLSDAAESAGFSEGHLSRLFASQVGVSFSDYLINVRLRHVKELLINTSMSIAEIANHTGFSNSDYLSACFRRKEGMTPTAFRKGAKH